MFPPPLRCIRRFFLPWPFLCRTGACFHRPGCFFACRARCPHRAAGWIFSQGYFAASAASDFLDAQKVTKNAPGGGANRIRLSLILHAPHPLEPPLRGLPLGPDKNFRRAKSEWRSAIPSGPLGPGFAKIRAWCGSTTAPGFSQPTLPVRFHRRGDPCGRP